jgi:hypothetical protein
MIGQLLEQYQVSVKAFISMNLTSSAQAVDKFLDSPGQEEITEHSFDETTLQVLRDIRRFLEAFHLTQEVVSAEKTPAICCSSTLREPHSAAEATREGTRYT